MLSQNCLRAVYISNRNWRRSYQIISVNFRTRKEVDRKLLTGFHRLLYNRTQRWLNCRFQILQVGRTLNPILSPSHPLVLQCPSRNMQKRNKETGSPPVKERLFPVRFRSFVCDSWRPFVIIIFLPIYTTPTLPLSSVSALFAQCPFTYILCTSVIIPYYYWLLKDLHDQYDPW